MVHALVCAVLLGSCLATQSNPRSVNLVGNQDVGQWVNNATSLEKLVRTQGQFQTVYRAKFTKKPGGQPWDIGIHVPSAKPIQKGRLVTIHGWMRSETSSRVGLVYEQGAEPFAKFINREELLGPVWREVTAEGISDADYAVGSAQFTMFLGYGTGSIEFADLKILTTFQAQKAATLVDSNRISNGSLVGWLPTGLETFTSVDAKNAHFTRAVRAQFTPKAEANPWDVSLHVPVEGAIGKGHTVYMRAWMRSPTNAKISMIAERSSEPFNKFIDQGISLTPDWKEYRVAGISDDEYTSGKTQLTLFLGYGKGVVEIGDLRAEDLGFQPIQDLPVTITYYRSAPSDVWRAPALARIEKFRKGELGVSIVDRRGRPIKGASVHVEQIRQEFRFGTAAPAAWIVNKSPVGDRFRKELSRLFNTVTFENDLKWHTIAPESYQQVDEALIWLRQRGFRVRGHNLVWGSYGNLPRELKGMSNDQISTAIHSRITEMVSRFKGKLYLWDVVNEAVSEHELWDRIGWDKFAEVYRLAKATDPNAQLCYNDFDWTEEDSSGSGHRVKATALVKKFLSQGVPIDVIGIQAHVGTPITPMSRVVEIMNEIAKLGKPLEITEYDLGVLDDQVNGNHMADFLTAMYSVPKVQSFLMWGFWAGAHWRAKEGGAMLNLDWSQRKAATVWEDLVRHKWWTHQSLNSDSHGHTRSRVFFGDLKITATFKGRTASLIANVTSGKNGRVKIVL